MPPEAADGQHGDAESPNALCDPCHRLPKQDAGVVLVRLAASGYVYPMKVSLLPAAAALLLALALPSRADDQTAPAVKAAEAWLALVDAGDYAASWQEAAPVFKEAVAQAQWEASVKSARGPLGQLESRELIGAKFTTTLPGAPDGEYVVIQFKTKFAHKAEAVETVTPMKDPAGVWRVSGYFVR